MKTERPPTIDPVAAARWASHIAPATPWLHEEVGRRMESRLQWIARKPRSWVDWEPLMGSLEAHQCIEKRYPSAASFVVEQTLLHLEQARKSLSRAWWQPDRWTRPATTFAPPSQPVDMVWANMRLHTHADPLALMQQWHANLAVDGFVMFSCLGPDTLQQLRSVYARNGWPEPSHQFTDMHDWGDMLVQAGFAEPVMDMARITLTYSNAEALLVELRGLGRNLHIQRFQGLRSRNWRKQLLAAIQDGLADASAEGRLCLTFEIIYGHAFKPVPRIKVSSESVIGLDVMREALARPRPPGPGSR